MACCLYRRQAIIWTNAGILLIGPLGTNFSEILIEILTFSFKKMRLKVLSAKRRPFCLGLNVLTYQVMDIYDFMIILNKLTHNQVQNQLNLIWLYPQLNEVEAVVLVTQMIEHFAWIQRLMVEVTPGKIHFSPPKTFLKIAILQLKVNADAHNQLIFQIWT